MTRYAGAIILVLTVALLTAFVVVGAGCAWIDAYSADLNGGNVLKSGYNRAVAAIKDGSVFRVLSLIVALGAVSLLAKKPS